MTATDTQTVRQALRCPADLDLTAVDPGSRPVGPRDKKAAADAYLARGNVYYSAGQPRLYKYALADFRQVLKYDPENGDAKGKVDTIESIYKSLGRPIPEVSPEP